LIGLPLNARVAPTNHLSPLKSETAEVDQFVKRAWAQRPDLRAAEAQLRASQEARKAAGAERLPSININATGGLQGTNPNRGAGVYQAQAAISIPVFQGGRIEADIRQADAVVAERRAELADERRLVEADVRNAFVDLQVANDQVVLSASNRDLATRTLQQSLDRFSVGVADSVEVVNSQQAMAAADHDYVNGLFAQRLARITLAHSTGEAEKDLLDLFEGTAQ
jgi:outer membrane protein TolC